MIWPFSKKKSYRTPINNNGWWSVLEPFSGAWQQNIEYKRETVLAYYAVFACTTLIASDICKLATNLVRDDNGIWVKVPNKDYSVLDKPNSFQNRIQFFENWVTSKLTRGNAYILKQRDRRGKVTGLYVLSPDLVQVVVSDDGEVFYQLNQDNLTQLESGITVPASEIIHDRFNCIFHPLIGLSPLYASGLAAYQGIKIQENSAKFFKNQSRPSGILTAPGAISKETAETLKASWEANYGGENMGKVAVLGDDLKYQGLAMTAEEAQMVDQLRLTADVVCSTFHVPSYKVIGQAPSYNNIEALEQQYYSQCLQILIESIELLLDEGLEVKEGYGFEFDLDGLLRMDSTALYDANTKAVGGGWLKPDEARRRVNMKPVSGGDTPYLQMQNYSLAALAKRDAQDDPFAKETAPATAQPIQQEDQQREFLSDFVKLLEAENVITA